MNEHFKSEEIEKFIGDQLSVWPLAASNFRALKTARTRHLTVGGVDVVAQFNPGRIASTTAEELPSSVIDASQPAPSCFLCTQYRPKEQFHIKFDGRKGRRYNVQINPYPILPGHLVIARDEHVPQSIWHYFVDMMDFARKYPGYLVFYNGPHSGASLPQHMHFQAVPVGSLPLQNAVDEFLDSGPAALASGQDARVYHFPQFCRGLYALRADTPKSLAKLFYRLVDCASIREVENEPRLNLYVYCYGNEFRCFTVFRSEVRSHHYYSEGEEHLTMTPGAADMAGTFVCPLEQDFEKLDSRLLEEMLDEVCISSGEEKMISWRLTRHQWKVDVPVLDADRIRFEMISDGAGPQEVSMRDGKIDYGGVLYDELYFDSVTRSTVFAPASFVIYQGDTAMRYAGTLRFSVLNGTIRASNHLGVENYLLSKMSEDLSTDMPLEEVEKAVIQRRASLAANPEPPAYKGLNIEILTNVRQAVDLTWGQINI